jgi:hypothetical protein
MKKQLRHIVLLAAGLGLLSNAAHADYPDPEGDAAYDDHRQDEHEVGGPDDPSTDSNSTTTTTNNQTDPSQNVEAAASNNEVGYGDAPDDDC